MQFNSMSQWRPSVDTGQGTWATSPVETRSDTACRGAWAPWITWEISKILRLWHQLKHWPEVKEANREQKEGYGVPKVPSVRGEWLLLRLVCPLSKSVCSDTSEFNSIWSKVKSLTQCGCCSQRKIRTQDTQNKDHVRTSKQGRPPQTKRPYLDRYPDLKSSRPKTKAVSVVLG